MPLLRISGRESLYNTTRAIVGMIHRHKHAEIQGIGRSAVKRAEWAVFKATRFLEEEGITIVSKTWNIQSGQDDNEKEGIRFILHTTK